MNRFLAAVLGMLLLALAACGGPRPVVVMEGAEQTAAAATAFYATETAVAAATASLPPLSSATPYIRPADPDIDPATVIAAVAGDDITLAEFRDRVRYERWLALESLRDIIDLASLTPADIGNPQNTFAPSVIGVLYTLSQSESFAETVLTQMIRERIMHQEYDERGLPPNTRLYENMWIRMLGGEAGGDANVHDLETAYMARIAPYTGIGLDDLRTKVLVRSEQQTLLDAVGNEMNYEPRALDLQIIVVDSEEEAQEILGQLGNGADFAQLARERSLDEQARGNGGDLGFFGTGEMVPEFERAAFAAAPGELVGPVQTTFGYHVIQVVGREYARRLSRIVVSTEADAQRVLERLEAGESFDDLVRELSPEGGAGSDLGMLAPDDVPEAWRSRIFDPDLGIGGIVGPLRSADGYNILRITGQQLYRVHARHILSDTPESAEAILQRLRAGEDFAAVAREASLDPSAGGDGGHVGFVSLTQLPPPLVDALAGVAPGQTIGPIQTDEGYYIVKVLDSKVDVLSPAQIDELKALHFQNWLRGQVRSVAIDEVWRSAYPDDPRPEDISPMLTQFEIAMNEALAAMSTPGAPASE